ncbi:hypothetical protein PIB30_059494 [Stylosanthes scabra]|uniref:Uncharacterized protein n=1 Tax=Stylosanthes scabra TaxID=79078 RepID=A0ABU6UMM9_9FABA|nr:hypothetical protein [Stylosanthes scabra]
MYGQPLHQAYVPEPPPILMYEQPHHAYVPQQEAYESQVHSQPPISQFGENSMRNLEILLGYGEGDLLQALFSQLLAELQPQPVVMPGRTSFDCIRPPWATASGGHSQGRVFVDSWISGGDYRRGPIFTQHAINFNESTAEAEGPPEGDDNSEAVESQQEVGQSDSGDGRPYNQWKDKKKASK